ncbi:MAG: hypothetical protein ABIG87_01745 [Patescibacteria group bacterium]
MKNKQRDKEVNQYYKKLGWKVVRVWEHDLDDIAFVFEKWGKENGLSFWRG